MEVPSFLSSVFSFSFFLIDLSQLFSFTHSHILSFSFYSGKNLKLYEHVKGGRKKEVLALLRAFPKLSVNFTCDGNNTLLHLAVMNSNDELLNELLSHQSNDDGAEDDDDGGGDSNKSTVDSQPDPFLKNNKDQSVFDLAFARYAKNDAAKNCVRLLLEFSHRNCSKRQLEMVKESLKRGASLVTPASAKKELVELCNETLFEENPVEVIDSKPLRVKLVYEKEDDSVEVQTVVIASENNIQAIQSETKTKGKKGKKGEASSAQMIEVPGDIYFDRLELEVAKAMVSVYNIPQWYRIENRDEAENMFIRLTNDDQVSYSSHITLLQLSSKLSVSLLSPPILFINTKTTAQDGIESTSRSLALGAPCLSRHSTNRRSTDHPSLGAKEEFRIRLQSRRSLLNSRDGPYEEALRTHSHQGEEGVPPARKTRHPHR